MGGEPRTYGEVEHVCALNRREIRPKSDTPRPRFNINCAGGQHTHTAPPRAVHSVITVSTWWT